MSTIPPLTIVPIKLDSISKMEQTHPSPVSSQPSCIIQIKEAEIMLFNSVEERIVQTIMRELNK